MRRGTHDLNRGFALTLECFERLERLAFFRRAYLRAFHNMADELRARTNYELTETLRDRKPRESAQFGRLRVKWEASKPTLHNVAKSKPFYR